MTAPPPPSHAVDRPALLRRLDSGLAAPVTLLIAPAGSGKTVLLSQWAATRDDLRFVWVDVDPSDDDPVVLARKLLDLLTAEIPEAGDLPAIGASRLRAGLADVLDTASAASPATVVIVFDDLHNLTNRAVVADLGALSDRLPPRIRFLLSSRAELRLDWGRRRLQHAPVEMRQSDLAFDVETVSHVLERISGTAPSPTITNAVLDRTEGWAAGVHLTAITLRHRTDPETFAAHLAGSDRLIADYLSEEVLRAQPAARRELLLRMSVLDRMSAELVEAATGAVGVAAILDELERDSMFLVPLDDAHSVFRFHHLFRDLLRYRLRAAHPGEDARILERAADWHLANGDTGEATECLLRARRWDAALTLILTRGREVFERGETASVSRWLGMIPAAVRQASLDAEVLHGMLLGMSGHGAAAEDVLRRLAALPALPIGHALIVHAYLATRVQLRPDPDVSLAAAMYAIELLESNPDAEIPDILGLGQRDLLIAMSLCAAGRAHFLLGDLVQARTWLTRALATPGAQYSVYRVHILGSLALVEAWSGRLGLAQSQADEALALARDVGLLQHPAPSDAYLALALTAVERGDPLGAAFTLHEGIARAASNQRTQLMWIGYLLRALTHRGDDMPTEGPPPVSPPPIVRARLAALTAARSGAAVFGPVDPGSTPRWIVTEPRTGVQPADPIAWDLAEPLTDRERELLAYLPSRLTNAELAARCFVSVNTIKTHMAHIYRKLDAPNRDAAIARAHSLGLL